MLLFDNAGFLPLSDNQPGFVARADEDEIASALLRPFFTADHETLIVLAFDTFDRLRFAERIESPHRSRCAVPAHAWRALSASGGTAVRLAHNHPSGNAWPSEADLAATRQIALTLTMFGADIVDHQIFVERGHFSFRRAGLL